MPSYKYIHLTHTHHTTPHTYRLMMISDPSPVYPVYVHASVHFEGNTSKIKIDPMFCPSSHLMELATTFT